MGKPSDIKAVRISEPRVGLNTWHKVSGLLFCETLCYPGRDGTECDLARGWSHEIKQTAVELSAGSAGRGEPALSCPTTKGHMDW